MIKEEVPYLKKVDNGTRYDYIDNEECIYKSPLDWLWVGLLGGCGCGNSERLAMRSFEVLEGFSSEVASRKWLVYGSPADEILAHWLDSKGLIEHGSSIGGGWLTVNGEAVYKNIKELLETK